ncbi:MAG TPA: glutamate--tRNA ligase [Chitinophagaceae bacterium]|nr:glutamate--tRNA ligase [Chitinophagaceae bacterium]
MSKKVRVRFAPSPTGGLHIGGVRTALYNYLFAKHQGGDFILRIEDTDQTRFVPGAEEYIMECLQWCGIQPDESPAKPGAFAPYRQSERKELYRQYAEQLVTSGNAYYAFDTTDELDAKRKAVPNFQYNHAERSGMKNSLSLSADETASLLQQKTPHVIRIKMPENADIHFTDMIRGEVTFHSALVDDKVLLKADGMPTYHLAVVVDDYLMEVTHAFRGEEWLPSAPVHILLWQYLFGLENMPQWAHLPLILKPDGNGKLSKRDGDRLGFPVFAMNWTDPRSNEFTQGFREKGFLPEAFINMLAMLGWNDGTDKEIFALEELVQSFSMERVHKGGAKFDYEKAKWFNHEWIKKLNAERLKQKAKAEFEKNGIVIDDDNKLEKVIELIKDRCTLLPDFVQQGSFFFQMPADIDTSAVKPKWDEKKNLFFAELIRAYELMQLWQHNDLETSFKEMAAAHQIKPGEVLLPFRIMLVGGKFGPGVFDIAVVLGKVGTIGRIKNLLHLMK